MYKYVYKNLKFKYEINHKVRTVSPKIKVKTTIITKPIYSALKAKKETRGKTIVSFGSKILKLCLRIKTYDIFQIFELQLIN